MSKALDWLLARAGENSTWRGLVLTCTGLGIAVDPERAAAITAVGLAVVGLINVIRQASPTKSEVKDALESKVDK